MKWNFLAVSLIILVASCEDEKGPSLVDTGTSFFPLMVGQERVYTVEETNYLITGEVEIQSYLLREEIVDLFFTEADSSYIIYRYIRMDSTEEWSFLETWQARRNDFQGIVIEGNTPFLKLTFPIFAGRMWDGNRLNSREEDTFVMDSLYFAFNGVEQQFDSTLTVVQNDNQDFIVEQDRRFEVYAYDVGLIYKKETMLQYCTDDNCLGQQLIETGREFEQQLIYYEN